MGVWFSILHRGSKGMKSPMSSDSTLFVRVCSLFFCGKVGVGGGGGSWGDALQPEQMQDGKTMDLEVNPKAEPPRTHTKHPGLAVLGLCGPNEHGY